MSIRKLQDDYDKSLKEIVVLKREAEVLKRRSKKSLATSNTLRSRLETRDIAIKRLKGTIAGLNAQLKGPPIKAGERLPVTVEDKSINSISWGKP